jgi:hypothetical protein
VPSHRLLWLASIQSAAYLVAQCLLYLLSLGTGSTPTIYLLGVAQGAVAAAISWFRRDEPWWYAIHLVVPIAAVILLTANVPPTIYLLFFLVLLGFNWHVVRNRVPYFPSGHATWRAVASTLPEGRSFSFVDIGSGLGGLNFYLSKQRVLGRFVGVEISPIPYAWSVFRNFVRRAACDFRLQDYNALDLSKFDFVFAYLSPAVMADVWVKARSEMRPGSKLISFEFDIPGVEPDEVVVAGRGGRPLYIWTLPPQQAS